MAAVMLTMSYSQIALSAFAEETLSSDGGDGGGDGHSIVDTYSGAVASALARAGDLTQYDESVLDATSEWVVITGMAAQYHPNSYAHPDSTTPSPLLDGAYVWGFKSPIYVEESLSHAMDIGEIEAFYPLHYEQMETRGLGP